MYVSDYGFAASPNYWTTAIGSYNTAKNDNWLFSNSNSNEWTITSSGGGYVYFISTSGSMVYGDSSSNSVHMMYAETRPCFYLNSDVEYANGSGTESDPIRLKID